MITSLILTSAVGTILGLRFKVFVLAPAILIVGGCAIIAGLLGGHDARLVVLIVAGTLALLQIGYIAGCLLSKQRPFVGGPVHGRRSKSVRRAPSQPRPQDLTLIGNVDSRLIGFYGLRDCALRYGTAMSSNVHKNSRATSGRPALQNQLSMTFFVHDTRSHSLQHIAKRVLDIILSAMGLIILSPLFLLTLMVIKFESRGPIFFIKFEYCYNDQRIRTIRFNRGSFYLTRVGHFLVRSGLDRLPMLINVLRGDMSIVGPRCHVVLPSAPLSKQLALALDQCPLRPGLITFENQALTELRQTEADLYYISNWSLLLDAEILFGSIFSTASYVQTPPRR